MSVPEFGISLQVIYARNDHARRIIAGCMSAMPIASEPWEQVDHALADVPAMGAVIARLTAELAETRMDRANLLAAMRAAIGAHVDGEADPLYYLRDELNARQTRTQGHQGKS
jgi:predicted DNA-binding ribbon-helix-helix protein